MTEVLVDRAPRVRCYECGHDSIFSLCHHCQRPMCKEHSPKPLRQGGELVREPSGAAEDARPVSKELAGLRLGRLREAAYHCKDHDHMVRDHRIWIASGAGVAALGFLLLFASAPVGLVLLLIGAIVGGVALFLHRAAAASGVRPPLPLVPQVNTVDVIERMTGYVRLEDGEYTSTVASVEGAMTVEMSANEGHVLLHAYRKKFRLPQSEPVRFAGGFLMMQGDVGLAFRAGQPSVLTGGTGVSLGGDSAEEHDLFPVDPELPQREATLAIDYEVQEGRSPREIPLWIVPSLVPASDRRALEIDLHWNRVGVRGQRLSLAVFDLIELEVPASWGNVESFAPGRVEIGLSAGRRTIRWKQLKPGTPGASSLTLKLRFERPITEVPEWIDLDVSDSAMPDDDGSRSRLTLAGKLEATFNGLLSGVSGVGVYLPGGGPGHPPPATTQTKVEVTFDASLRSIRYQDERVVPDENNLDDVAFGRNRADEFHGVVPDHRIVAELTNAISMDSYYVKSVVEHPPHRDDGRPGVVNRVWDVAGRLYIGLFPIDFDINLRGEEASNANGFSGRTVAQVTVKGAYAMGTLVDKREFADANDAVADLAETTVESDGQGDELLRRIEDTWTSLHARVTQVLADRASQSAGTRAVTASAENVYFAEVLEPEGDRWPPDEAVTVEAVEVPVAGFAGRAAGLRQQRKAADEAVVMGRISEETHRGIITRIEGELGELGESS